MKHRTTVSTTVVIAAVVALLMLAAVLVVVAGKRGADSPATALVLSQIALAIPALLALLKVDATRNDLKNGLIPQKIHEAVQSGVMDGALSVKEDRTGKRDRASDQTSQDPTQEGA